MTERNNKMFAAACEMCKHLEKLVKKISIGKDAKDFVNNYVHLLSLTNSMVSCYLAKDAKDMELIALKTHEFINILGCDYTKDAIKQMHEDDNAVRERIGH